LKTFLQPIIILSKQVFKFYSNKSSLAKSFTPSPQTHSTQQEDFKAVLLSMPNVGEDSDFARVIDYGRELELSD
jgi:hypothetical protein